MKSELKCTIVQDLLPNYIDELTSEDTNEAIESHLKTCGDCKEAYEQMAADMGNMEKVPAVELKFLKKIKRTRLMAAALCIMATVGLCYALYASEFKFTSDKSNLSAAITEYTAPFKQSVDAYVLETKEIDGLLIATFKDQSRTNVNGLAFLKKGINGRYRLVHANIKTSDYFSVVHIFREKINSEPYYIISGYNLSNEIKQYGLDYYAYKNPGYNSADRVRQVVRFDVKNSQFLDIYSVKELDSKVKRESDEMLYDYNLFEASMYNSQGIEITDDFLMEESKKDKMSAGIGTAEREMLYVFMAIVAWIGYIITKYILTE